MNGGGFAVQPHISPKPNGLAGLILDGAADRRKRERATLCGQEVECIEMTVRQRVDIMQRCFTKPNNGPSVPIYGEFYPALLINGLVEPGTNNPVFTLAHTDAINGLPGGEVQDCADRVMRLSGLSQKAEAEIAGNSGAAVLAA